MNKKMLTAIIAMAVVLVILVAAVLVVVPMIQSKEMYDETVTSTTAAKTTVPGMGQRDQSEVLAIRLQHDDVDMSFSRKAYMEDWVLDGNESLALNQSMVSSLISNVANGLALQDVTTDMSDLAQFGLDPAKATMTLTYDDNTTAVFHVGDLTVNGNSAYAYREGEDRVVLVASSYYDYVVGQLYTYVKAKPFSVDGTAVRNIRILKGEEVALDAHYIGMDTFTVGAFTMTEPYQVLADTDFDSWLTNFSSMSLLGMVYQFNDQNAKYGLDKPAYTLTLGYDPENVGGTGDFTMYIGSQTSEGDAYYVGFEGEEGVYSMKANLLDPVTGLNAYTLTNRTFMLYQLKVVDEITVTEGSTTTEIVIKHPENTSDDSALNNYCVNGKDVQRKAGGTWYQSLLSITSNGALPKDYEVTGEPTATVHFDYAEGAPVEENTFEFFPYEKDYYAVRADGQAQFYCRRERLQTMLDNLAKLQNGELDE